MSESEAPFVVVPSTRIPVVKEVDVLVCGGGPAGICAAVAAARMNATVMLIERHGCFGGMATSGLVTVWHKFYGMDNETQVIHGLPVEITERLTARRAARCFSPDGKGGWAIDSETAKLVFDELVLEAGVTPLLHTWACDVLREGERISAVIIQNKSGRQAVRARVVVDATGDADIAARAGAPFVKGDAQGLMQPPSLCFRLAGIDPQRAQESLRTGAVDRALNKPMDYNGQDYPNYLWTCKSLHRDDEMMLAGVRVTEVDGTDAWSFTRAELEGRKQLQWVVRQLQEHVSGFERAHLVDIAAQIGIRETRRIIGEHVLQESEVLEGIRFPDCIAQGTYSVDIHNPLRRGIIFRQLDGTEVEIFADGSYRQGFWTPDGQKRSTLCYQVPYRCLVPRRCQNLLVAGRCISTTHEAHGATRVMVNCMQTGQAAGVAAALCAQTGQAPAQLDLASLHRALAGQGCVYLPVQEQQAG